MQYKIFQMIFQLICMILLIILKKNPLDIYYYNINNYYNGNGNRLLAEFRYERLILNNN